MTPRTDTPPPRSSLVARYGPLAAVLVAVGLVAALASTGREGERVAATRSEVGSSNSRLPITWAEAEKAGTTGSVDWADNCDPKTGRITIPSNYAPPCVAPRPGVKGGATYPGVTADTITVVAYELPDDDLSASLQSQLDAVADRRLTGDALLKMVEDRFSLWGRRLKVIRFQGTGSDETSARADAIKVATEFRAFASLSGPSQQGAYAEELASRGVVCVGCGLSVPDSEFQRNAPYLWGNLQTPEQFLVSLGDYLIGRLNKKKAVFAGDAAMHDRTRVFGAIHFEQDPPVFGATEKMVEERGARLGYTTKVSITYQLVIAELAEKARTIMSRMKEEGVTTVIFLGDPIMPIYLTQAATDQDYFPEWIITGTVLTDTTSFGRRYDQEQWAHAFGISSLPARLPQDQGEAWRLVDWYTGRVPDADKTAALIWEPIRILALGLHLAGPDLTPETFRDGLFGYPPTGGGLTTPQLSFGDHGFHEAPDYLAVDDMQEIWWDAEAEGLDEQGVEGKGMLRYADGGQRYLPGEMPKLDAHAFVEEGSVLMYDEPPAGEVPPRYPSPAKGG
ncbi:MAG: hypothetical protein JWM47_1325 [Acidimicrobiales bacterium]|nr:hypothetical protein [Acidimicrobiales bacterium]